MRVIVNEYCEWERKKKQNFSQCLLGIWFWLHTHKRTHKAILKEKILASISFRSYQMYYVIIWTKCDTILSFHSSFSFIVSKNHFLTFAMNCDSTTASSSSTSSSLPSILHFFYWSNLDLNLRHHHNYLKPNDCFSSHVFSFSVNDTSHWLQLKFA